jgi:transposase
MARWNQAPVPREQILLIATTLEDRIAQNHPVRLFAEILDGLDWSSWERHYCLVAGQPPIHPKVMAGAILYGLTQGIRSSRRLEWACANAVDFMWLAEGRVIDHSTFCGFRTRFRSELKDLFRQIGRVAIDMGLARLNQVMLDGTMVKANSSRHGTASAKTLTEKLAVLDEQVAKMLAEAERADRQDTDLFGESTSSRSLPAELSDLKKRQTRLSKALQSARQADAKRERRGGKARHAAKAPVTDPDSAILPNKEGGYAPNYLPVAGVEGGGGFIVEADVLDGAAEAQAVIPAVEHVEADFGKKPDQFIADSTFGTGGNLSALEDQGIEALMPQEAVRLPEANPAERADPTVPVPRSEWDKLPRRPQTGKLDRAAFVYDARRDCYYCPAGRKLELVQVRTQNRDTCEDSRYRVYECSSCEGCELAGQCLKGKAPRRWVSHDQHERARRVVAARMKTESGRQAYARRAPLAETPYAVIKHWMGLRQFLHRGLDKVRMEWLWACTAFNLKKLMGAMESLCAPAATKVA